MKIRLEWNGKTADLEVLDKYVPVSGKGCLFSCLQRSTGNLVSVNVNNYDHAEWWHNDHKFSGMVVKYIN